MRNLAGAAGVPHVEIIVVPPVRGKLEDDVPLILIAPPEK